MTWPLFKQIVEAWTGVSAFVIVLGALGHHGRRTQ